MDFYRDGLGLPTKGIIGREFEHGAVAFSISRRAEVCDLGPGRHRARYGSSGDARQFDRRLDRPQCQGAGGSRRPHGAGSGRGAEIVKPAQETFYGGYAGYFLDPDGHLWEVVWNRNSCPTNRPDATAATHIFGRQCQIHAFSSVVFVRQGPAASERMRIIMSRTRVQHVSVSLDGFATGEGQSLEAPFGHAGERLHEWMFVTRWWHEMVGKPGGTGGVDDALLRLFAPGIGAEIMGAGKYGHPGWHEDPEWKGWWGANPPFHTPVFVLTHHVRAPIEMEGGTTFHFVDASPAEALEAAREAAGDKDMRIGGGPTTIREFLTARPDRPHAHRGRPDPARSRRAVVGWTGGP